MNRSLFRIWLQRWKVGFRWRLWRGIIFVIMRHMHPSLVFALLFQLPLSLWKHNVDITTTALKLLRLYDEWFTVMWNVCNLLLLLLFFFFFFFFFFLHKLNWKFFVYSTLKFNNPHPNLVLIFNVHPPPIHIFVS